MKKNNYFPMPNGIFCLGLNSGEIAVYTHVTTDMQQRASVIVGNFMNDILGEELKI